MLSISDRLRGVRGPSHRHWGALISVVAGLAVTGAPARAQTAGARSGSVEVTLGPSTSWTGERYNDETSFSVTIGLVANHSGPGILGFEVGFRPSRSNRCVLLPGSSQCGADLPGYAHLAAPFGGEVVTRMATYRAAVGPAFYFAELPAYGARAQADAAAGLKHLKLVLAARGDLIRHGRETLGVGALEVGLRVQ